MQRATVEKETNLFVSGEANVRTTSVPKARWNMQIKKAVEALGITLQSGQKIDIELAKHNLIIAKYGMYRTIFNEGNIIIDRCESIDVLENGWIVACRHGRYDLYYKDGSQYEGLIFLKKANAIRFANTL